MCSRTDRDDADVPGGISRYLESLFEHSPSGYVFFDQDLQMLKANPAFCRLIAVDPENIPKYALSDFITFEDCILISRQLDGNSTGQIEVTISGNHQVCCQAACWQAGTAASGLPVYCACFSDCTKAPFSRQAGQLFLHLAENVQDMIYCYQLQPEQAFSYVNAASLKLTGYTPQEFYRDPNLAFHMIHPEDRETLQPCFCDPTRHRTRHIIRVLRKDGTCIWCEHFIIPVSDCAGQTVSLEGILRDITESKEQEEAHRRTFDDYQQIFNSTQASIFIVEQESDGQFRYVRTNTSHQEKTGFSPEEIIGKTPVEAAGAAQGQRIQNHYEYCIKSASSSSYEEELQLAGGTRCWLTELTPVFREGRRPLIIGSSIDITASKQFDLARRKTERWIRSILLAAPTGIGVVQNGTIQEANVKACEITGRSRSQLIGCSIGELFADPDIFDSLQGQPASLETQWVHISGELVDVLFTTSPIEEKSQETYGYIFSAADITRRKQTERSLRESEERFRSLYENATLGIYRSTPEGHVLLANPALLEMLGYNSIEELSSRDLNYHGYAQDTPRNQFIEAIEAQGSVRGFEASWKCKDGGLIHIRESARAIRDSSGKTRYYEGTVENITRQRQAETEREQLIQQLHQTQKIESVGRLAGGVAHDFNNMLGVILGYTEIALEEVTEKSELHAYLKEIQQAAKRSGDLTRQLLTFARKQTVTPSVINVNQVITDMLNMLDLMMGEGIELFFTPEQQLWNTEMDISQLHQVMTNLLANSRDSISGNGQVIIRTKNYLHRSSQSLMQQGEYVCISVKDTGAGMDELVRTSIFEPYFTTKELGKGTGLGLSSVLGIVSQNRGHIDVASQPGKGTEFFIYLPKSYQDDTASSFEHTDAAPLGYGNATILFVEDEEAILELGEKILKAKGFQVITANSPQEALTAAGQHAGEIDLLITDVIMPGMNGKELQNKIRETVPELRTLFISGYSANVISLTETEADSTSDFLTKPFSVGDLVQKTTDLLKTRSY